MLSLAKNKPLKCEKLKENGFFVKQIILMNVLTVVPVNNRKSINV